MTEHPTETSHSGCHHIPGENETSGCLPHTRPWSLSLEAGSLPQFLCVYCSGPAWENCSPNSALKWELGLLWDSVTPHASAPGTFGGNSSFLSTFVSPECPAWPCPFRGWPWSGVALALVCKGGACTDEALVRGGMVQRAGGFKTYKEK